MKQTLTLIVGAPTRATNKPEKLTQSSGAYAYGNKPRNKKQKKQMWSLAPAVYHNK
jgi:hypothetical protein